MAFPKKKKRKKKQRNPFMDWLGYALMRIALFILFLFPVRQNLRFACFLGNLMWKHYHRGRNRAMDNLRASFPDKDDAWLEDVGRRSFQHIVMLTIDLMFSPRLVRKDNWRDYAHVINFERVKWMMLENKGLLMLTGHYGNFEIMGYAMGLFGFNVYSIARPLDNPFINKYLPNRWPTLLKRGRPCALSLTRTRAKKGCSWTSSVARPARTRALVYWPCSTICRSWLRRADKRPANSSLRPRSAALLCLMSGQRKTSRSNGSRRSITRR
jgi:hypothetical protein